MLLIFVLHFKFIVNKYFKTMGVVVVKEQNFIMNVNQRVTLQKLEKFCLSRICKLCLDWNIG